MIRALCLLFFFVGRASSGRSVLESLKRGLFACGSAQTQDSWRLPLLRLMEFLSSPGFDWSIANFEPSVICLAACPSPASFLPPGI